MMKMLIEETDKVIGRQSVILDDENQFFLVTSISDPVVNKTSIVLCRPNGTAKNWNELYTRTPADHSGVIMELLNGSLTKDHFQFKFGVK
jgi:hypothetical protein